MYIIKNIFKGTFELDLSVMVGYAWYVFGSRMVERFLYGCLFIYLKWSFHSDILLTCMVLHAFHGYCRQKRVNRVINYLLQNQYQYHKLYETFQQLVNDNRVLHAISVKLHAVLNYSLEICWKGFNNFWRCWKR